MTAHRLLQRQLAHVRLSADKPPSPEAWADLLARVEDAYALADQDRKLLERSLELTSAELLERNKELEADINRRKAVEDRLRSLSSLTAATVEATADGILVVDQAGHISLTNERFREMWRIPRNVLESGDDRAALAYVSDQLVDPHVFVERVQQLYAEHDAESFDVLPFKDGRIFERFSRAHVIDGKSVGRVWSFRDVTEQRRLAQQAEEQRDRLARAERLTSLGTLVAGVAHEVNNPLTYMHGNLILLDADLASLEERARREGFAELSHLRESLKAVLGGVQRIAHITKSLRLVARGSQGERAMVDPNTILESVESLIQASLPDRTRMHVAKSARAVEVLANGAELHQVVLNIVHNAIQALQGPGGNVTLAVHDDGAACHIMVTDDGPGMSAEVQAQLFNPFYTTKAEGTGLGLSIARRIMRDHGGDLSVRSAPGKGTTMDIMLPLVSPASSAGGPEVNTAPVHLVAQVTRSVRAPETGGP